jgi:Big-like domain-containing protein
VGSFDDGSTQLLPSVTWSSASPSVATIDPNGYAIGLGTGVTTITATSGSVSGTASLTVTGATLVSIAVTPANSTMLMGSTKQFTATGTFSDSSTQNISQSVLWTSSNPSVASISGKGLVTSIASGNTNIKAVSGSISGLTALTVSTAHLVSIDINPANARIQKGTSLNFTVTAAYSDGSTATILSGVSWKSSKPSVVSIRGFGRADGKKSGTVTITASLSGVTANTTLTVGSGTLLSLAISPVGPAVAAGGTQQFTATGTFSDGTTQDITLNSHWSSSSGSVASIENAPSAAPGLAHCLAPGISTIGANSGGITGSGTLTVQ